MKNRPHTAPAAEKERLPMCWTHPGWLTRQQPLMPKSA